MPGKSPVDYFGSFAKGYKFGEGRREVKRKAGLEERQMVNREGLLNIQQAAEKRAQDAVPTAERGMSSEQVAGGVQGMPGMPTLSGSPQEGSEAATGAAKDASSMPDISTPAALTALSSGRIAATEATVKNFEKDTGISGLHKSLTRYTNYVKDLAGVQKYNRHQTYLASKQSWDRFKKKPLEAIDKAMVNADGDETKLAELQGVYDAFDSGEVLDSMFSASARYEKDLQAAQIKESKAPTTFEAGLTEIHRGDSAQLEGFFREKLKSKGKSSASRFPDKVKAAFDMVKLYTKNKPSLQEQIMAGFMKSVPGMEHLDVSSSELSGNDETMLNGGLKIIADYLKIKTPKSEPKKTKKKSWRDYQ